MDIISSLVIILVLVLLVVWSVQKLRPSSWFPNPLNWIQNLIPRSRFTGLPWTRFVGRPGPRPGPSPDLAFNLYDTPHYYPTYRARRVLRWDRDGRCAAYCSTPDCAIWCR